MKSGEVNPLSVTPLTFTGTSQYSSDFQAILNRAVSIASIPLQQLQNQDQTALSKKGQLGSLNSTVSALTSAVSSLGTLASSQAIAGSSSDATIAQFTATGATSPASYTVNSVVSLAAAASETSVTGYNDSAVDTVSTTGSLNLLVGGNSFAITLTPETNNLIGLQNAINAAGAGVTASILTTGSGNYLSISSNSLGATTLQLLDDPQGANQNILTATNQGANAVFYLNNLQVTRSQNTINDLIPGGTLALKKTSATPVTLSLASDPSQLASAIQNFASAYNSVVDEVDSQTGKDAGVLNGDSIISQIQSKLRELTNFQGTGSIKNLADLGISLGSNGKATFDPTVFSSLSQSQLAGAFQFFGSVSTGFGGLSKSLAQISDPVSGAIASEISSLTQTDVNLQSKISDSTARINSLQFTLFQQLSQADTLITTLTTQQSALTASIQSLNYVLYGKSTNS